MRASRRLLLRTLVAGIGLALLGWTLSWMDPRRVLRLTLESNAWWLAGSAVLLVNRFLIWGAKWHRMLAREARLPIGFVMANLMSGAFVNLTTPTAKVAGGLLRSLLIHRRFGWSRALAYGWTLADQITNVLGTLVVYGTLAAVYGSTEAVGSLRTSLLGSAALAWGLVVAALVLRRPGWSLLQRPGVVDALARIVPKRFQKSRRAAAADGSWVERVTRPLLSDSRLFGPLSDILWSIGSFGALCASNAMVLWSLGVDAGLVEVTIAVVIGYFAGTGFGAWGGLGVTEAAMTAIYVQVGVPPEQAAAGVLLHRASYYALVLGWGGAALMSQGRYREKSRISEPGPPVESRGRARRRP